MTNPEVQGERQVDGEKLDAPISLTPEELETVDLNVSGGVGIIMGFIGILARLIRPS